MSKGLASLADTAENFESKTILGLLRSAPDLSPHSKHVKAMFKRPEDGEFSEEREYFRPNDSCLGSDELVPQEGKDEMYDTIMEEISGLEEELEEELKNLQKKVK